MFDRKLYLYFILAILGFLIWNAWQADYPATPPASAPVASSQQPPAALALQQAPVDTKVPLDRFIEVKLDSLLVKIDKLGGNIVSLQLPNYPVSYEKSTVPETLLTDELSKYYGMQSGFIDNKGVDTANLLFSSKEATYQLQPGQNTLDVTLKGKANGQEFTKTYSFTNGKYAIKVNNQVTNKDATPWVGRMYAQVKRRGLTEDGGIFGLHTYTGGAVSSVEKPYEKVSYKEMDKKNLDRSITGGWLAMQERYFVSAFVPSDLKGNLRYYSQVAAAGPSDKPVDKIYTLGFQSADLTVPANGSLTLSPTFYSGPEMADYLKQVAPHLDLVIDYGWFWVFSVPIFKVMEWIYLFVRNWGLAIILVTVLIKLLFYKLSESSYRSMARMRHLQPRLLALKDRYGEDRQKLSQATMELYKKEKVNPLGGCLPMIIQIPVFIALYYVLIESVQLRQAPFVFWIHDLSAKDPFYILPILMGISWMLQQKLNPPPPDPMQAKLMMLFPLVFTFLFATFPAGLVLYWLVNNCVSILQQWYIMRKVDNVGKKKSISKERVSSQ